MVTCLTCQNCQNPDRGGRSLVSLSYSHTLSADLLSMHHGLEMVTHDFVTNPASDMSGGSDVAPPSLVTTVSNKS